ncbi:ABC transporter substrate-binding protein [Rubellimicrobium sp. CFH 75288]|uniref:ABC transporter substrate-binding protein n=1 Tax=Rubellimicrobium sp. CFH 75288 TaxID=2697034 RepID=UPI0014134B1E|nr:ABC transporter substrate-binding protein [Rubellimicrobium sp. CFH 75288]NAZ37360.1 hypothetical protein [Rubellimicrobium sp. CFH 75288]
MNNKTDPISLSTITRREFAALLGLGSAAALLPRAAAAQDGPRTLVFALPDLAGNLEPHKWGGFGDYVHVMDCVGRGLTHMDFSDPDPQPAIAESWSVSEDGLAWDFAIRPGLTFHDGAPIDAEAVHRTFSRMLPDSPERPEGSTALDNLGGSNVLGFEVVDPMTFRIRLAAPDAAILGRLSRPDMVILSPRMLDAMPTNFGEAFSSCGPFRIVSVAPNERAVLEAFDGFYGGRPAIERVVMQVLPEPVTQLTALASGDLHVTNLVPHSNLDRLAAMPGIEVATTAAFISVYLAMNASAGILGDMRVRRAINRAIDREAVVREAFFGKAEVPGYISPAAEAGFDPSHLEISRHDPEEARALLEEAGAAGATISLICENHGFWPRVGQVVERSLREAGLNPVTEYLDVGTYNGRMFDVEAHELAFLQRSAFFPDPDGRFSPLLLSGTTPAQSVTAHETLPTQPELDAKLVAANAETDPAARAQLYVELNTWVAENVLPYAAVVNTYLPVIVSADVEGVNVNALGTYRTFLEGARFVR